MLIVVISMDNKMGWSPNFQGNNDIPSGTQYCPISFLASNKTTKRKEFPFKMQ
jgi:hypothetical protein